MHTSRSVRIQPIHTPTHTCLRHTTYSHTQPHTTHMVPNTKTTHTYPTHARHWKGYMLHLPGQQGDSTSVNITGYIIDFLAAILW